MVDAPPVMISIGAGILVACQTSGVAGRLIQALVCGSAPKAGPRSERRNYLRCVEKVNYFGPRSAPIEPLCCVSTFANSTAWLKSGGVPLSAPIHKHGWIAVVPVRTDIWVPKALVSLQIALRSGGKLGHEFMEDPRLSLTRWPAIEEAVRGMSAAARP